MVPLQYNVRSLFVRRINSFATLFGVALVALVFSGAQMLAAGVERTVAGRGRDDVAIIVRRGSESELTSTVEDSAVAVALARPEVAPSSAGANPVAAAEVVVVAALPKVGAKGFSNVTLRGVESRSASLRPALELVEGRWPAPNSEEAMVGRRIRGRFQGLTIGDSFELRKNRPVRVVGVFADDGDASESEVWMDREVLRAAFGRQGSVSSLRVQLTSRDTFDSLQTALEGDKRLGVSVLRERTFLERQSQGLGVFIRVLGTVVAVLFSIGTMIGAMITMHGSVAHRRREIGTLRALGFSSASILTGFLAEAVVLTSAGGLVGSVAALGLSRFEVSMINYASWSELVFTFAPTPAILLSSIAFAMFMGLVGGLLPAVRAARIPPLEALRAR
ncbi:MAG: ABC transporter permease [Polyangiaceae bacterium]